MSEFQTKRPILFEIILIVISFAVAAFFTAVGRMGNLHPDLCTSAARILVGLILLLLYRKSFRGDHPLNNLVIVLPALLFVVWNLYYNLGSGAQLGGSTFYIEGLLTAFAPALFEEVLFRGIFIRNLRNKGTSDMACLFITAIVFAAAHMTNIVGQSALTVAIQVGYSFVIGMVLAAIYLKNGSLVQIIAVHLLIDFTTRIYLEPTTTASTVQIAIFAVLLIAEAVYAVWLTRKE